MPASQSDTPYLDALRDFAQRGPARLHVPGHKGGAGADSRLMEAIGERALALDIPALMWGIDVGVEPTPFAESQRLAAEAWGARRTWFMVNGASQGNHVALMTLAHSGSRVVLQRNAHSSTIDALVLSGLLPTFAAPELDPDLHVAHCLRPETLDAALSETPDAVGAAVVSPTYFGAVADVAALAEVAHGHGVPLVVDEAWGAHLAFSDELPAAALSQGADLVISSTHKIVGSLTQSAMVHLGHGDRIDEDVVDSTSVTQRSTTPSSIRSPCPRWIIADWVRLPTTLWMLEITRSAPRLSAGAGSSSWKPRWAPQASSTTSGTPCACATSVSPATSATAPK